MNTLQGNVLIAKFMGATVANLPFGNDTMQMVGHPFPSKMWLCKSSELEYDSSFDWLMPVVEKMDEFGIWCIRPNNITFQSWAAQEKQFHFHTSQMDWEKADEEPVEFIFLIWHIVVKGIQWYNTTHSKQK